MEYKKSFGDYLSIAEGLGETLVGYGNPNGSVLIVANEPGTMNEDRQNLEQWKTNYNKGTGPEDVCEMFDAGHNLILGEFNPLHPFKGQRYVQAVADTSDKGLPPLNWRKQPTSRSWKQYQKFIDILISGGCTKTKTDRIDFFENAFTTDFSSVCALHSSDIPAKARIRSIEKRLPMFQGEFIGSFPVIIIAAGHYIKTTPALNDLSKVFQGYDSAEVQFINDEFGWRNIHYRSDGKGILVHCKHFASTVSDEYLEKIAECCQGFVPSRI